MLTLKNKEPNRKRNWQEWMSDSVGRANKWYSIQIHECLQCLTSDSTGVPSFLEVYRNKKNIKILTHQRDNTNMYKAQICTISMKN